MRRGQILSLDALLSLVIVVMVIGVVINTNDMIKAEITNLVEWYDRANIANNMLDILTKSPGYPKDWEHSVTMVKVVGLRSVNYSHALDYYKLMKLNSSINIANVKNSLVNLSTWRDFQIEFYLTTKNISITGKFPEIIDVILESSTTPGGINILIQGENGRTFTVRWVTLERNGILYTDSSICLLRRGANVDLEVGDILRFETNETIYVSGIRRGVQVSYTLPPGTLVELEILSVFVGQGSNIQINYGGGSCPYEFKIVGQGNVRAKFKAESPGTLSLSLSVLYPVNLSEPTYSFAVINGTVIRDINTIDRSKNASPWIEYQERNFVSAKLIYNRTMEVIQGQKKELIVGKLKQNVPNYAYFEIKVPEDESGNVTFAVLDGALLKGLLVKKDTSNSNITAILAWKEGTQTTTKSYIGNTTTIKIPWRDIFSEFNSENGAKPVEFWLYENNFRSIILRDLGNIGLLLEPKFDPILIKLWVWDDR